MASFVQLGPGRKTISPGMTPSLKVPTLQFLLIHLTSACFYTAPKAADTPLKRMANLSFQVWRLAGFRYDKGHRRTQITGR